MTKRSRVPRMSKLDESKLSPGTIEEVEAFYGEGVSGVLRAGDVQVEGNYRTEPVSFLVQRQLMTAEGVSPWHSLVVYSSREAAEKQVEGWEKSGVVFGMVNRETGEHISSQQQPVTVYRIVTLGDLLHEGPESVWWAMYGLATSDHEWHISTETGAESKRALIVTFELGAMITT